MSPLVAAIILVSILGNLAQVGFMLSVKAMAPNLERLNFFTKALGHFFNKQVFGTLVGSLSKMAIVAIVIYLTVSGDGAMIKAIATLPLVQGISFLLDRCMSVVLNVTLVLIVVALADFIWNRHVMEEKMKMSKQEVKDEQKDIEGNPHVKAQMRRRALDMSNQRMMKAVPDADVIVNNPTHLSVALRYRRGQDAAPIVLAKGADLMALRIRRIAKAHSIPTVQNVPLARALYKHVKVGRPVPSRFYRAVAEVLAYVYRLKKRRGPSSQRRRTQ
jgi:flagellar biosynthesis protein FlhB